MTDDKLDVISKVIEKKIPCRVIINDEEAVRDMTYSVDSRYEMTFKGTSPSLPEGQSYEIRVYSGRSEKYNIVDFLVDENNETNRVNYK